MAIFSTGLLIVLLVWAVLEDVTRRRIPNVVTLGGLALAILLQGATHGLDGLIDALAGMTVGLAFFLPAYLLAGMGAGDVKLMAAVGAFFGPIGALMAAAASAISGGLMGMVRLVFHRGAGTTFRRYGLMLRTLFATGRVAYVAPVEGEAASAKMPYALAIASGTLFALWLRGGLS